jgi:hypothetical protein
MFSGDVRRGIVQAEINKKDTNIYYAEILIASVLAGILLQSWLVFGIVFVILAVGINIPIISTIIILMMCIVWGLGGFIIGSLFTPIAGIVIGGLFFIWSLSVHRSAREYTNDYTDMRDRSRY